MRAVIKQAAREDAIEVAEVERPRAGPGQVVVEVGAASVCGSDLHIWHWAPAYQPIMTLPTVLGHEFVGRVADIGPGVTGVEVGERVVSESILTCGRCRQCRRGRTSICDSFHCLGVHGNGGMAEFALTEARLLHRLPDELPFEQAALIEPLSVATHAVVERSGLRPGDLALVFGPGPIGQLAAQVARAAGAQVVMAGIEADQAVRLAAAEQLGFPTINVEREAVRDGLLRVSGRDRADLAFECAGAGAAVRDALEAVVKGGTIVLVALYGGLVETDLSWVVRREISLQATYAANWSDYERSIGFLRSGAVNVKSLINPYPLEQADRAFKDALERQVMKPVLIPG
jgi:2-desacetyl-2-hydroxyethyl bacteriochlorophyllide A dehydrogenase